MNENQKRVLLSAAELIAVDAGRLILEVQGTTFATAQKSDNSPVTLADHLADALIVERLRALSPGLTVVSEESGPDYGHTTLSDPFWLVDPLDGTKEFIKRNGEFTVNIALIHAHLPVLGVVNAPALKLVFSGGWELGATVIDDNGRHAISVRTPPPEGVTVVSSRSHGDPAALDAFLSGRKVACVRYAGSSLKLCVVARGEADVYPRLGRTMEWDVAAGHAILRAAGGRLTRIDGSPFEYGKSHFENPPFVAWGACTPSPRRHVAEAPHRA